MLLETASAMQWRQLSITFTDPDRVEHHLRAVLGPALGAAEDEGLITGWFFIRKNPWRLRYLPAGPASQAAATTLLHSVGDHLERRGAARWVATVYEPETRAFGGAEGMQVAHRLFHADSSAFVAHLTADTVASNRRGDRGTKRRELSLLLCAALMRAAGLDRYEQGDVWARLAAHRPQHTATRQRPGLAAAVQRLTTVDTAPGTALREGNLAFAEGWLTAFENTGRDLRALAEDGRLSRGIRAVITHHVIFHWNRLGLTYSTQSALAHAAAEAAFADPRHLPSAETARPIDMQGARS